jgi:hypothetical protein
MATDISTKLVANVVASVDLDPFFPAPAFKGLVAFDVYVEKGEISTGKRVFLVGQSEKEQVTVKGIEMRSDPADPNKVRVLCCKPKTIKLPLSSNGDWTIAEE